MAWLQRLLNTFRPSRVQRDNEREISCHLAERSDQLRSDGASDAEARRRARVRFGNPQVQAERVREVDITGWLDSLVRTLRYATRAIVRTRGFRPPSLSRWPSAHRRTRPRSRSSTPCCSNRCPCPTPTGSCACARCGRRRRQLRPIVSTSGAG